MAKKASTKFKDDLVSNNVITKYGDIVESGEKVLQGLQDLKVISLSPALDMALGGGLREGAIAIMTGDPKTGKTTTCQHFIAKCQALGKPIIFINTEDKMTKENFIGIKGLDPDKIKIVQASEDCPVISAEMHLTIIEMYVKNTPDAVIVVDSTSNMVPQCELEGDISGDVRNKLPRMLSIFLKRIAPHVRRNKVILICITHNIANTSGSRYAPKKMADCGNMLQFQAATNMVITHRGKWLATGGAAEEDDKDSGPHVGQIAYWKIITSAAGGIPMSTAESWIRYGIGIDETQEVSQIAIQLNLIKKAGAWFTIKAACDAPTESCVKKYLKANNVDEKKPEDIEKAFKFQGIAAVNEFLNANEPITQFLYKRIKEMI